MYRRASRKRSFTEVTALLLIGAVAALVFLGSGLMLWNQVQKNTVYPTEEFYGILGETHEVDDVIVDQRQHCRIRRWGLAPVLAQGEHRDERWAKAMHKSLLIAGLPEGAAKQAVGRVRQGNFDAFIMTGNKNAVLSNGMVYKAKHMTTFKANGRYAVCLETTTAFRTDDQREAARFFVIPFEGKIYHVGEYVVCGNVSVFTPAEPTTQADVPYPPSPGFDVLPDRSGQLPRHVIPPMVLTPDTRVNEVPEPGTLFLVGSAVVALLLTRRA